MLLSLLRGKKGIRLTLGTPNTLVLVNGVAAPCAPSAPFGGFDDPVEVDLSENMILEQFMATCSIALHRGPCTSFHALCLPYG